MKVLFDNNLSPHLAHALNVLLCPEGDQVVHLTDRFPANTDDRAWIRALGVPEEIPRLLALRAGHPSVEMFTTDITPRRKGRMVDFGGIWKALKVLAEAGQGVSGCYAFFSSLRRAPQ